MSGRKGLFYTIDAFVAFGILSIGVVLFLSGFSFEGASSDPQIRVDYVRDFFSSTLLGNVNSDYVIELRGNGSVVSDVSIFQQLVIFHHLDGRNNLPSSEVFFENVVEDNVFDFNLSHFCHKLLAYFDILLIKSNFFMAILSKDSALFNSSKAEKYLLALSV